MTTKPKAINLKEIRIDGGTQSRVEINEQVVSEYAELMASGTQLPPVTVFQDEATYWLVDGFHRVLACRRIDCEWVFADIHPGTQRDAILYSVGVNATHGLRRTNADKRKAVLTLLNDEEWSEWSDRKIALVCGVSAPTVSDARKNLTVKLLQSDVADTGKNFTVKVLQSDVGKPSPSASNDSAKRTYTTRHGTLATMNTTNIGRRPVPQFRSQAVPDGQNLMVNLPMHSPERAVLILRNHFDDEWVGRRAVEIQRQLGDEAAA